MSFTYMLYAFLLGRLLFGGYFIGRGLDHFIRFRAIRADMAGKDVPLPALAVGFSGLLAVFGGLSLVLGYEPRFGLLLLVVFLLIVMSLMHDFWTIRDPIVRRAEQMNFLRASALFGAVIMMVAIPTPWRMSFGQIEHGSTARVHVVASPAISPPHASSPQPASPSASAAPSRRGDISRK